MKGKTLFWLKIQWFWLTLWQGENGKVTSCLQKWKRERGRVGRRKEIEEKGEGKKWRGVQRGGEIGETRHIPQMQGNKHRDLALLPRVHSIKLIF